MDRAADWRIIQLLQDMHRLTLVVPQGLELSPAPDDGTELVALPGAGLRFVKRAVSWLGSNRDRFELVIAQGDLHAATAVNLASRLGRLPALLLFDRPTMDFVKARGASAIEMAATKLQVWTNHRLARRSVQTDGYTASKALVAHPTIVPLGGVDVHRYLPGSQGAARDELSIDHRGPLVLLVSRPPNHDLETFFTALGLVAEEHPGVGCLMADPASKARAEALGVPAWNVPEPFTPAHYQAADVVLHSCITEGLEIRLVEAMSCGSAIVASATWPTYELVALTGAGITAPIGDHLVMADAILWFLRDAEGARGYGTVARQIAAEHFSSQVVAQLWQAAIEEAIGVS